MKPLQREGAKREGVSGDLPERTGVGEQGEEVEEAGEGGLVDKGCAQRRIRPDISPCPARAGEDEMSTFRRTHLRRTRPRCTARA